MDISFVFTKSFEHLRKKKYLLLPSVVSFCLSVLFILLFLFGTGSYTLTSDMYHALIEYQSEKDALAIDEFASLFDEQASNDPQSFNDKKEEILWSSLAEYDVTLERIKQQVSPTFIAFLILLVIFLLILFLYKSCATVVMIAQSMGKPQLSLKKIFKDTNSFFSKYVLLLIILLLISILCLIIPFVLLFAFFAGGFMFSSAFVIIFVLLGFIIFILALLGIILYVKARLIFSLPLLILENNGPFLSISNSIRLTKKSVRYAFFISVIIFALQYILSAIGGSPLLSIFVEMLFSENILVGLLLLIILILFIFVYYVVMIFCDVFLFHSFIEFKKSFVKGGNKNG